MEKIHELFLAALFCFSLLVGSTNAWKLFQKESANQNAAFWMTMQISAMSSDQNPIGHHNYKALISSRYQWAMIFALGELLWIKHILKTQELSSYSSCSFVCNSCQCCTHSWQWYNSWLDLGGVLSAALMGQNKRRRIDEIDDSVTGSIFLRVRKFTFIPPIVVVHKSLYFVFYSTFNSPNTIAKYKLNDK